jgi:hypothetical protein
MKIQLVGYAPDQHPTTPGVLVNCTSMIPTLRGMAGAPSTQNPSGISGALAGACQGAASLRKLDESVRTFAGTGTDLFEISGGSWTEVTRASGGDYGLGADVRWRFAQFGNVSLAVAKSDTLQASTTGAFADVAGAPEAGGVEVVGQFVFLWDTNEGVFGDSPHRWWCSAKGDHTDWTPAVATECATSLITSTPGKIRSIKRFGPHVVIYKLRSIHFGIYAGQPSIWNFDREISSEAGALSHEAVVDVGTPEEPRHIFMGFDDFYEFNGGRPTPLGQGWVKETVFNELNKSFMERAIALLDRAKSLVYFFYPSGASNNPDKCVVYNYKTKRWGRADRTIEHAFEYSSVGISYDDLGSLYSTYNDLPNVAYDSTIWTSGAPLPAVFDSSHVLKTLDGSSSTSGFRLGDFGDDEKYMTVLGVTPQFTVSPSSASLTNYYRQVNLGDTLTTGATTALSSRKKFDFKRSARWHVLDFTFNGPVELARLTVPTSEDGNA